MKLNLRYVLAALSLSLAGLAFGAAMTEKTARPKYERHHIVIPDIAPDHLQEELEKLTKRGCWVTKENRDVVDGKYVLILTEEEDCPGSGKEGDANNSGDAHRKR
jgi:hypothetical protein